jgi:hypothetical protein
MEHEQLADLERSQKVGRFFEANWKELTAAGVVVSILVFACGFGVGTDVGKEHDLECYRFAGRVHPISKQNICIGETSVKMPDVSDGGRWELRSSKFDDNVAVRHYEAVVQNGTVKESIVVTIDRGQ